MEPCNGCGKCCVYGGNGRLGPIDQAQVDAWSISNPKLLSYIRKEEDETYRVWVDPKTNDFFTTCPWLIEGDLRYKYHCAIHNEKPKACLNYPMSVLQMIRDSCEIWQEEDNYNQQFSFEEREIALQKIKKL